MKVKKIPLVWYSGPSKFFHGGVCDPALPVPWESRVSWMLSPPCTDVSNGAFRKLGVKETDSEEASAHSGSMESVKCKDSTHVTSVKGHTSAQPIPLSQVGAWGRSLYCEGVFTLTKLPGCVPGCVLSLDEPGGTGSSLGKSRNWVYPRFQS